MTQTASHDPGASLPMTSDVSQPEKLGAGRVDIVDVCHDYSGTPVLRSVNLSVGAGEFVTLLGPSGSGKSTLLHIIAGLQSPTSGRILVDDVDILPRPPQDRNVGLVFQNYALFPHLTAAKNVSFPLEVRKLDREQAARRVEEMLALMDLGGLGHRLPGELSGGQQQRVAIGRALAPLPGVLLLDEPLGALDKRLRQQLGREIRRIQQRTGVTAIYVTHDQEEAFTMSDRIAVMQDGEIRQLGAPEEIYDAPTDQFVAGFLGEMNSLTGRVASVDDGALVVDLDAGARIVVGRPAGVSAGDRVACMIRPERVAVWPDGASPPDGALAVGEGAVVESVFLGGWRAISLRWRDQLLSVRVAAHAAPRSSDRLGFGWSSSDVVVLNAENKDV
jgi:ABC-type Fe3+/spermidine/putrescine transport system ATPase subunit